MCFLCAQFLCSSLGGRNFERAKSEAFECAIVCSRRMQNTLTIVVYKFLPPLIIVYSFFSLVSILRASIYLCKCVGAARMRLTPFSYFVCGNIYAVLYTPQMSLIELPNPSAIHAKRCKIPQFIWHVRTLFCLVESIASFAKYLSCFCWNI